LGKSDFKDLVRVRFEVTDLVRKAIQKRSQLRPLVLPIVVEI